MIVYMYICHVPPTITISLTRPTYVHTYIHPEQEKAGDARIGPRGVWTQAGGAGGSDGPLLANAGRIPANPVNTNVLVLEQGAKAGKARVVWFESLWILFVYVLASLSQHGPTPVSSTHLHTGAGLVRGRSPLRVRPRDPRPGPARDVRYVVTGGEPAIEAIE